MQPIVGRQQLHGRKDILFSERRLVSALADENAVTGELGNLIAELARLPGVTITVLGNDVLTREAALNSFAGRLRNQNLLTLVTSNLRKYLMHLAPIVTDALHVQRDFSVSKDLKTSRINTGELRLFLGLGKRARLDDRDFWSDVQRKHRGEHAHARCKPQHGNDNTAKTDTTRGHGHHLAVLVEPSQADEHCHVERERYQGG